MFQAVCVFILLLVVVVHGDPLLVRQTTNGPVQGIKQISSMGQEYYVFRSIPYAEPPITGIDPYTGQQIDRRFKAPEPLKRTWTEVLKVDQFKSSCFVSSVILRYKDQRSEDCLFLNVYVPVGGAERKTVMVWLHGGGFTEGEPREALYGPDFLMTQDNIVVTVHYRLGIFGFLNLGAGEYTGNMGLKDQQMAMKWVHENIEHFSGNRKEILLFGESAGGASVVYHMLNKRSRTYFKRAYAASGSPFSYFALTEGNHTSQLQDCSNTKDMTKLLNYLKTTDSKTIRKCQFAEDWGKTLKPEWVPTIEKPGTLGAFITQSPDDIYNSNDAPFMDALFSFTNQEQILFDASLINYTEPLITENWNESTVRLPFDDFNATTYPNQYKTVMQKLRRAYYSNANTTDEIIRENIALMSDLNFADSVLKTVILQTKSNNRFPKPKLNKNTFLFRFGVNDALSFFKLKYNVTHDGAAHAEELCYLFHCHLLDDFNLYERHLTLKNTGAFNTIMQMVTIVTNFARTGNPSIKGDTPFKPCTSESNIFCHEITNNPKSSVTNNIKKQLHYDTWRDIEQIYKQAKATTIKIIKI